VLLHLAAREKSKDQNCFLRIGQKSVKTPTTSFYRGLRRVAVFKGPPPMGLPGEEREPISVSFRIQKILLVPKSRQREKLRGHVFGSGTSDPAELRRSKF